MTQVSKLKPMRPDEDMTQFTMRRINYEHLTDAANRIQVHINDAHHWQDNDTRNYARGLRAALDAVLQGLS